MRSWAIRRRAAGFTRSGGMWRLPGSRGSGFFPAVAGLAGALVASRVGSANTTAGQGYFLQAYAAVFIGCTVSKSGVPCVGGTLIGAAVLAVLANGLTILLIPSFLQSILTGGIIILAVIVQKIGAKE